MDGAEHTATHEVMIHLRFATEDVFAPILWLKKQCLTTFHKYMLMDGAQHTCNPLKSKTLHTEDVFLHKKQSLTTYIHT